MILKALNLQCRLMCVYSDVSHTEFHGVYSQDCRLLVGYTDQELHGVKSGLVTAFLGKKRAIVGHQHVPALLTWLSLSLRSEKKTIVLSLSYVQVAAVLEALGCWTLFSKPLLGIFNGTFP